MDCRGSAVGDCSVDNRFHCVVVIVDGICCLIGKILVDSEHGLLLCCLCCCCWSVTREATK